MAKLSIKWKIEIIIALLIIIVALLGFAVNEKVETYSFEESATYFLNGIDYQILPGAKASINDDNNAITIDRNDGTELYSVGLPVYLNDSKVIMLINDMAYFEITNYSMNGYKLTYFTKVESLINIEKVKISWQDKVKFESTGFLYDGDNTYVMLQNCYLEYNEQTVKLSPLSYVVVTREGYVEYYDYENKYYHTDDIYTNVEIRDVNDKYTIIADYDFLYLGSDMLMLQNNVSNYGPYFVGEEAE